MPTNNEHYEPVGIIRPDLVTHKDKKYSERLPKQELSFLDKVPGSRFVWRQLARLFSNFFPKANDVNSHSNSVTESNSNSISDSNSNSNSDLNSILDEARISRC